MVADELRVEGTEKVQGADDPVGRLLGGFLLFLQCNKNYYYDMILLQNIQHLHFLCLILIEI